MKTKYNFNFGLVVGLVLFCAHPIYKTIIAQDYLNINTSGGNFSSLLNEMKEITFDESGNATFTKTDDSFVTIALTTITDLTVSPTSNGGSPLPVELVSFVANIVDRNVILNWSTATEVDNYGFFVQRKKDADENWIELGFLEGAGNSSSPKEYNYSDELSGIYPVSKLEYRLKQIDTDGSFVYSDVVNVQMGVPDKYELSQNYPNPFNPATTINFQLPAKSLTTLKVYDILGKEIAVLINEEKAAGKYSVSFDASQLASGVYFSRLTAGSYTSLIKMLLLR